MEIASVVGQFVLVALIVTRIGRFGAEDILAEGFRKAVAEWSDVKRRRPLYARRWPMTWLWSLWDGLRTRLGRGVHCRWCWSVWASIVCVPIWWMVSDVPHLWDRWYADIPPLVLALSQLAALVERHEPED